MAEGLYWLALLACVAVPAWAMVYLDPDDDHADM